MREREGEFYFITSGARAWLMLQRSVSKPYVCTCTGLVRPFVFSKLLQGTFKNQKETPSMYESRQFFMSSRICDERICFALHITRHKT